ncbi:TIGR01548 family HAD-type hydrolase [Waterburya agarophytonicola K14]|uniref:TIGR01548 family HAD-type hydrolase n=1 Tax=Waterburya agarophytonicola KI4 TaxID=2874699 RepID=A0A964FG22_9CYAN|nr:TIGR01548 family HAD-type hydrolase [Waterburya agarophytonicola]MCC0177566.1 TIGR01548 family HAD-type hydrolase [Waterburya agarophytonicola KI4]
MKAIIIFDIDGVIRDVGNSYRKAISDTVEHFTDSGWRPTMEDLDNLKSEGIWNNDWEASQELVYRYFEAMDKTREEVGLDYDHIVEFFQKRYRGKNPQLFDGYIADEPLLVSPSYFEQLVANNIAYGFFSGATRGSAEFTIKHRLKLDNPVLVAMEDAPSKPNPQGMFDAISQIKSTPGNIPVFYLGDTVADMYTVAKAKEVKPERNWVGVGILPPHVQLSQTRQDDYAQKLMEAGAEIVLSNVEKLDLQLIADLIK